jgi:hypothetical protein
MLQSRAISHSCSSQQRLLTKQENKKIFFHSYLEPRNAIFGFRAFLFKKKSTFEINQVVEQFTLISHKIKKIQ